MKKLAPADEAFCVRLVKGLPPSGAHQAGMWALNKPYA
jgi:hypothetical protein